MIHVDGDFKSNKGNCEYHCSPSCHPAQVGPEWVYGCTHKAWYPNRVGDFVPIVECGGESSNCDLRGKKCLKTFITGLKRRISNAEKKAAKLKVQLEKELALLENRT